MIVPPNYKYSDKKQRKSANDIVPADDASRYGSKIDAAPSTQLSTSAPSQSPKDGMSCESALAQPTHETLVDVVSCDVTGCVVTVLTMTAGSSSFGDSKVTDDAKS